MPISPYPPQPAGAGTGDALVASPLNQFAATSSAQLATVLNDETGTDKAVFNTDPELVTPKVTIPTYANEAAAIVGGIAQGKLYMTAAGEVRIKL